MLRQRGFTLLELLIAMAIFAIMSAMAYGGLNAVIQTRETVTAAMDSLAAIQKTIYRLQTDIESSQARPVRDEYGDMQPAMLRDVDGRGLYLTRAGWRNPLSLPRSALQRVYYRVEEKQLQRMSWPVLDGYRVDQPVITELIDNVEELRWRFLVELPAAGQDFEDLDWQEQWPSLRTVEPDPADLPVAVELLLTTTDWGEIRYLFRINPGMNLTPASPGAGGGIADPDEDEDEDSDPDFDSDDDEDSDDEDF